MEREEDTTKVLLETIRKEMVSIIEDGPESCKKNFNTEKEIKSQDLVDLGESNSASAADTFILSSLDGDLQKLQTNLDDCYALFQALEERFESINFYRLKNRVKDLHLFERKVDSIKAIVDDLKHAFDEKYMGNRLADLTKEAASKFHNHAGEFADIPEISEFFRTCSKLDHGLQQLTKHRNDCTNLQKRLTRAAEVSYERINYIQQHFSGECKNATEDTSIKNK